MEYFAYIIKSESVGTYYYGSAEDVDIRLKRHNAGRVRSTKGRRPWTLHYQEAFKSRSEAYRRELFFKTIDGYKFLKGKGII
jgi:putative endonuclease